jgi:methyl-accepting chemotaxis protein
VEGQAQKGKEGAKQGADVSGNGLTEIIKEINQMAVQTNFLALNAAVEAAHVGEAGLGFEVLTEKVQTLANRSKESAVKTEGLLQRSVKLAQNGEKLSQEVNQTLMKVVESVNGVSNLVDEIASASKEQAQGVEFVNERVNNINRITGENANHADKSSKAAEDLAKETEKLDTSVRRFKLDSGLVSGDAARPSSPSPSS